MTALATPRRSRLRVRLIEPVMPVVRVLRTVLRYVAMTAVGFAIGIGLALAVPLAFHARPLVVLSGSMEPALGTGDVSVVRTIAPLDARPGDVVTFRDPDDADRLITHRVREMHARGIRRGLSHPRRRQHRVGALAGRPRPRRSAAWSTGSRSWAGR